MNLGEFIDTYKEAIAQRVVESYPPLYRPSENGGKLPRLLRSPLGAQADAIRGAALSLEAHQGTNGVGEMGTGKTFIGAAAALLHRLRSPLRRDEPGAGQAVLPLAGRRHRAVGHVRRQAGKGRGDRRAV